jgi:hypothetical protein
VVCAAAFLAGGDDEEGPDRRWILDRLEEDDRTWLQGRYRDGTASLVSVFLNVAEYLARVYSSQSRESDRERTLGIWREFQLRVEDFGQDDEEDTILNRRGLSATVYEARGDDGVQVDPRVEALAARAHPATAIATGITIRRAMNFTCPARCGIIYGFRRQPRVSDISDGRLKDLAAAAAPGLIAFMEAETDGHEDQDLELPFVNTLAVWLQTETDSDSACYQLISLPRSDEEEVFPLAVFGFRSVWGLGSMPDMRATLAVPVAIQGMVVAVVQTDDHSGGEANVDLEYVGIEGYAYVPPGHGS